MNDQIIKKMQQIVGNEWVVTDTDKVSSYCEDETEKAMKPKVCTDCVVVKPANTEEISQIIKYANDQKLTVVARGGGTSLSGAAVTIMPSIIISMERMNKIIEVDESSLTVECEAGATLLDIVELFNQHDSLYFPIHPGDEGAQVGGMIVMNAGGVRAVRYGVMREQVKGLEVVLPTGEIIYLGGKLIKNNAGLDLKNLIIGSEGILGIVTKATLALKPKDKYSGSLLVSFNDESDAVKAVTEIFKNGIKPLAIEYMEKSSILRAAEDIGMTWPSSVGNVDLYFIVSERKEDDLYEMYEMIVGICEENNAIESFVAESTKEQRTLLEIRSHVYPSMQKNLVDAIDAAVPIKNLAKYMQGISKIATKYNVEISTIGHIGDGNMHNSIQTEDAQKPENYDNLADEIFKLVVECEGAITGEHGIGKVRNDKLKIQFSEKELSLMKAIKNVFDPNNILNPGTAL
ncbi:FAD-binding oxidoreductase [Sedimentibacter sp. MB31-C6]|uniref:FAD-binding oxidoreductase n=1 Tax=Sedimentibacter sp. MB31-C6 TaxID=3109366 RepID=UPI002DDCD527|nr:FAD-binding oxidoreductase [Sedimentibacter sp. MB36-C1]WSI03537.1 FAD-binding oxidoreductase [Sedimentibacter sp. MB36-C1]